MDLNDLEDRYNDFIDGEYYVSDRNETGSSDVLNAESDSDSDNTLNDSDDNNTFSENDSVDESDEEETVDLSLDGDESMTVLSTNVNDLEFTIGMSIQGEKIFDKRRKVEYTPRVTKKTNCEAVMKIKSNNGLWVMDKFEKEHNHILVDSNESFRLRLHQKKHRGTVELIERLHKCGIPASLIMRIVKDFAGGEQFAEQQLIGIFWVDSRAQEQYKIFGDVIVFDITYKKNKYKFSFAPFTGVNHNMQCTLLGCGLIADETNESFI
ncbi:protein FAR1-RELATED SEQUENCE 5-like [Telopea speciosissima]|uniref:protein FAR1-RELATED SEQUENCE 5-like n=1 Tax=Telopea speciosissima TaxID=54955 RepID=UPI001CC651F8|nr:protein FAR1-RELATED SEQUENCE 5-like [Telopea speciosissima]